MKSKYLVVIIAALFAMSCGGPGAGAPATAETADEPAAADPLDTAFGSEDAPEPEAAEEGEPEPAGESGEATEEASEEGETAEAQPQPDPGAPPPSADLQAYVGTGAASPEYQTVTANMDLIKRCYLDALSKNSDLFEFLHERTSNFSLQDVVEHITEQSTVIVEALERDFLSYIVCVVSHCRSTHQARERRKRKTGGEREREREWVV